MKTAMTTLLGAALLLATTAVASAQSAPANAPLQLVQSQSWNAFTSQGSPKSCYAISAPQTMEPANLKHGTVFFFVTTKPAEKIRNEPSIQVGYNLKEGSTVGIDIDGKKFTLFTKGDGAWLEAPAEEAKLVDALKRGKKLVATGVSARSGTTTTYTFALAGIGGALDAVAKECK